jgi:mitofusin
MFLQVRGQHMERAVDFLVKELKVYTQKEAHERIFFVSAREALQARLQEQKGLPAHSENKTITQPYISVYGSTALC